MSSLNCSAYEFSSRIEDPEGWLTICFLQPNLLDLSYHRWYVQALHILHLEGLHGGASGSKVHAGPGVLVQRMERLVEPASGAAAAAVGSWPGRSLRAHSHPRLACRLQVLPPSVYYGVVIEVSSFKGWDLG